MICIWPEITVIRLSRRIQSLFHTSNYRKYVVITLVARLSEGIFWSVSVVLIKWLVLPFMFAPLFMCGCMFAWSRVSEYEAAVHV